MSVARSRIIKWTVYGLPLLDFALCFVRDVDAARYTLTPRSGWLDYARAYVTSIDLAAWFTLILLCEMETCVLADRRRTGAREWLPRGLRFACASTILHTSIANDISLGEIPHSRALAPAANACAYAGHGWSFLRNRDYVGLLPDNCADLGRGPDFYAIGANRVLSDRAGLREGLVLAWSDLIESVAWLLVVAATEALVRMEGLPGRDRAMRTVEFAKRALYALIMVIALYRGASQQYLYAWDELLWVLGFLVIDHNISDWQSARRAISASLTPA